MLVDTEALVRGNQEHCIHPVAKCDINDPVLPMQDGRSSAVVAVDTFHVRFAAIQSYTKAGEGCRL